MPSARSADPLAASRVAASRWRLPALRVACFVGTCDAVVALTTAVVSRPHAASLVVGVLWVVAWAAALAGTAAVERAVRRRPWLPAAVGAVTMAAAGLDGGYPGNLATQPAWLVLVAAAVLSWPGTIATGLALFLAKVGVFAVTVSGPEPLGDATHPEARTAVLMPLLLVPLSLVAVATARRLAAIVAPSGAVRAAGGAASPPAPPEPAADPAAAAGEPEAERPGRDAVAAPLAVAAPSPLPPAERAVVTMLAEGLVAKEIAVARGTSLATVRTQIKRAKRRTGARTLDELVASTRRSS